MEPTLEAPGSDKPVVLYPGAQVAGAVKSGGGPPYMARVRPPLLI